MAKILTISRWIITFLDVYDFTLLNHLLSNLPARSVYAAKMSLHAMAKHLQDVTAHINPSEQEQRHEQSEDGL
jgi:hypothetical protein